MDERPDSGYSPNALVSMSISVKPAVIPIATMCSCLCAWAVGMSSSAVMYVMTPPAIERMSAWIRGVGDAMNNMITKAPMGSAIPDRNVIAKIFVFFTPAAKSGAAVAMPSGILWIAMATATSNPRLGWYA